MQPQTDNGDPHQESSNSQPHLSISSHVVVQLGEELVTDVEQALLELAKNAYDADSETCEIVIEPDWSIEKHDPAYFMLFGDGTKEGSPVVGRLQVIDHGDGLSPDAIRDGWLRISASLKRPQKGGGKGKTTKGRTLVGDKGLGRLATMKIGTVLRLRTALENEPVWRTVTFSWNSFTPNRTLEQVPVSEATEAREEPFEKGTTIEIIGLRELDRWKDVSRTERELIPRLSSLITPFHEELGFSVTVKHGRRTFELAPLAPEVLNLASAHFSFVWDGKTLTQKAQISKSLFRGKEGAESKAIYDKVFSNHADAFFKYLANPKRLGKRGLLPSKADGFFLTLEESDDLEPFPAHRSLPGARNPGPFEAEFYYFLLIRENVQKYKTAGINNTEQLKAMAGIGIFREGFRIPTDRDWLGIAEGQTSGGSFYGLRPANTIGYFTISNEFNPFLIEKSDREAFVDNADFRGFRLLSEKCLKYSNSILEVLRRSFRSYAMEALTESNTPQTPQALLNTLSSVSSSQPQVIRKLEAKLGAAMKDVTPVTTSKLNTVSAPPNDDRLRNIADELFKETVRSVEAQAELINAHSSALAIHFEDTKEQNLRLTDAAAVGLSARSLIHELHQYVRQYREAIDQVTERNKVFKDENIRKALRLLTSTTRELTKTVAGLDPLLPGTRTVKETFSLRPVISGFLGDREVKATAAGIHVRTHGFDGPHDPSIRFSRSRFLQILENLFQNSIYWLKRGPSGTAGGAEINVEINETGLVWWDTGPGIKPSLESTIFDAFVSDKPKDEGQGLGLHIVTTFLELERCSIRLGEEKNSLGRRYKFVLDLSAANPTNSRLTLF